MLTKPVLSERERNSKSSTWAQNTALPLASVYCMMLVCFALIMIWFFSVSTAPLNAMGVGVGGVELLPTLGLLCLSVCACSPSQRLLLFGLQLQSILMHIIFIIILYCCTDIFTMGPDEVEHCSALRQTLKLCATSDNDLVFFLIMLALVRCVFMMFIMGHRAQQEKITSLLRQAEEAEAEDLCIKRLPFSSSTIRQSTTPAITKCSPYMFDSNLVSSAPQSGPQQAQALTASKGHLDCVTQSTASANSYTEWDASQWWNCSGNDSSQSSKEQPAPFTMQRPAPWQGQSPPTPNVDCIVAIDDVRLLLLTDWLHLMHHPERVDRVAVVGRLEQAYAQLLHTNTNTLEHTHNQTTVQKVSPKATPKFLAARIYQLSELLPKCVVQAAVAERYLQSVQLLDLTTDQTPAGAAMTSTESLVLKQSNTNTNDNLPIEFSRLASCIFQMSPSMRQSPFVSDSSATTTILSKSALHLEECPVEMVDRLFAQILAEEQDSECTITVQTTDSMTSTDHSPCDCSFDTDG